MKKQFKDNSMLSTDQNVDAADAPGSAKEQKQTLISALQHRLDTAEHELQSLRDGLGVNTAADAIYLVHGLKAQIASLASAAMPKPVRGSSAQETEALIAMPDPSTPQAAMGKIRDFANKVTTLNGTIASMETQLMSLYADRERLEFEIGAGEVEDVIAVFRAQQAVVDSLEAQLSLMYADREMLDTELGRTESQEIVTLFRSVAHLVSGAQRELVSVPAAREIVSAGA